MQTRCNVCDSPMEPPIYESAGNFSVTTMNKLIEGKTRVCFCGTCGHLQTDPLPNLAKYYADEYEINLGGEDDDQLYKMVDGKPLYRADHQAAVLMDKVPFPRACRVLDYGCAKAATLRKVLAARPDIKPFLFDVTDKYLPYWNTFPGRASWAVKHPDPEWDHSMDVVLSFYALEHVFDLAGALANIRRLLASEGVFYLVVPNAYANIADFVVADHVNHFCGHSLLFLLEANGFTDVHVDEVAHDGAYVAMARLDVSSLRAPRSARDVSVERVAASSMATYWRNMASKVRSFEENLSPTANAAIYGAGFYGNMIASTLRSLDRVSCFVDQNRHLAGTHCHGKQVVHPDHLPPDVQALYVGLNPRGARQAIESVPAFKGRDLACFFL